MLFVDFMLDYPHEQKALQHRMNHLLKNLGYAEEGGRRAALNCLYLVVLHFPEAQLSSWSSLIFAAAAARLSAETDATAHQMLHVLILSLLRKINASSRERLLDLVLKWRLSAPTVLAECLGLFVEAVPRETSESLVSSVLQALAQLCKGSESTAPPPWQVSYAIFKSFERILSSVSPMLLTSMMDASDSDPGASLKYLWCQLLGADAFSDSRHAWQISVALRCLELQSAKWRGNSAQGWLQCEVTSYGLLGALQQLVTSKRIEVDTSLAPLAVKALRNLLVLVLHHPELVASPADEQEEDVKEELEEDVENPDVEDRVEPSAESAPDPEPKVEEQNQEQKPSVVQTEEKEKEEKPDEPTKGKLEEDELEKDVTATALEEPEGGRQGSVYDALATRTEELSATALEVPLAEVEERLRRSRVRWFLVRWSHQSQGFQANPTEHYVRLISWFRLCSSLVDHFPVEVLSQLLSPLLSPAYRCTSAFRGVSLPDVVSLEQALALGPAQRRGFLANLAQSFIDATSEKMTAAGRAATFAQALNRIRKAVEHRRQERVQKRRLQPVTNPEAAAATRRAKNRKKRKMEELIHNTKGGRGKQKVKQSKSLI